MNALEKIKEGVSSGVKAIEGKVTQLEADIAESRALREQQLAEENALKEQQRLQREKEKAKAAKAKERAKNRKRRALAFRRTVSGILSGLILVAVGGWYTLHGLGILTVELPVEPVWALGIIALGAAMMVTGRGIPIKVGIISLGLLILVRENGWLWGILSPVSVWHLVCAAAVLVAVIYITSWVVSIRNGTRKRWQRTKKAISEKTDNLKNSISGLTDKFRKK